MYVTPLSGPKVRDFCSLPWSQIENITNKAQVLCNHWNHTLKCTYFKARETPPQSVSLVNMNIKQMLTLQWLWPCSGGCKINVCTPHPGPVHPRGHLMCKISYRRGHDTPDAHNIFSQAAQFQCSAECLCLPLALRQQVQRRSACHCLEPGECMGTSGEASLIPCYVLIIWDGKMSRAGGPCPHHSLQEDQRYLV